MTTKTDTAIDLHVDLETMETFTGPQLIAVYNAIAEETGADPIGSWKKAKSKLIELILAEQTNLPSDEEAETQSAPAEQVDPEDVDDNGEALETREVSDDDEEPKRTIVSAALEHMSEIAYYEDKTKKYGDDNRVEADHPNAQSVGVPYRTILERILAEFEGAKTSIACLRWYAVKVNAGDKGYEGHRLPQRRPRAKTVKAES